MAFETTGTAVIEVEVDERSLSDAEDTIASRLGTVNLSGGSTVSTDGGGAVAGVTQRLDTQLGLDRERNDLLDRMRDSLNDASGGGGGGGGGGELLDSLPFVGSGSPLSGVAEAAGGAGITQALRGRLGGLGRLAGLAGGALTNPFTGALAAGGASGFALRETFKRASFDESELQSPADAVDADLAQTVSESVPGLDTSAVFEAIRTNGLVFQDPEDLNDEVLAALAEETPLLNASEVEQELAGLPLLPDTDLGAVIDAGVENDREAQARAEEQNGNALTPTDVAGGFRSDRAAQAAAQDGRVITGLDFARSVRQDRAAQRRAREGDTNVTVSPQVSVRAETSVDQALERAKEDIKQELRDELGVRRGANVATDNSLTNNFRESNF